MTIFTLTPEAKPKALALLPESVCNSSNREWLLSKIILPATLSVSDIAFGGVITPEKSKLSKKEIVPELEVVKEYCDTYGIDVLLVGVADIFKYLSDKAKFTLNFGKSLNGVSIKINKDDYLDFTSYKIVPFLNPVILNQYPEKVTEVVRGISVITKLFNGDYEDNTKISMKVNEIITDVNRAVEVLKSLWTAKALASDIETTGLDWFRHRILTISLSPNKDESYCFAIDEQYYDNPDTAKKMKEFVGRFLTKFGKPIIGHNFTGFDIPFIIHMVRNNDFTVPHEPIVNNFVLVDTILMAYLLKNSTERASIGLKELSFKYMGEYDADIDQRNLASAPLEKVATYNNYDCRATWLIYEEMYPKIKELGFTEAFKSFNEIAYDLVKMKMHGLRIDREKTIAFKEELKELTKADRSAMLDDTNVQLAMEALAKDAMIKYNKTHKIKKTDWNDFVEDFNPNSARQKKVLFFDLLNLPIIKKSKVTGEPSSDAETVSTWLESVDVSEDKKEVIRLISEYVTAKKIDSTYITPMIEKSVEVLPNDWRMFTNFNQTATITGRLSSSGDINLQTIPNSSKYGKRVKELFIAPDGFILATADYNALEDRLIANESGDQNKLNIFLKGIDGHSLNAYGYFKDEFKARGIELDVNDPSSINKVKDIAPDLRQEGKPYTFGLSYGAGPKKFGEDIYRAYWETYQGVKKFNDGVIREAIKNGYIISRFSGLRLLLPSITSSDEFIQSKEFRVACNFAIQSGNFLMLKAIHKMQSWIEENGLIDSVKLALTVHDSVYLYVKRDFDILSKVNKALINFMGIQYRDDQILPLTAELDIGTNMVNFQTLPNDADILQLKETWKKVEGDDNE